MKTTIVCLAAVLSLAAVAAAAAPGSGFDGAWTGHVPGPNGQQALEAAFTFHVDGSKASGTVDANGQTIKLVDLTVDGSTIAFSVEGEEQNTYRGTLDGDRLQMHVTYSSHENGDRTWSFALTRAPAPAGIDGDWTGEVPRGGDRTIPARFSFRGDSARLSGSVNAVNEDFPLEGRIDGDKITFTVAGTIGSYSGTVEGDAIRMTVKYDGGETGRITLPFVLTRVR